MRSVSVAEPVSTDVLCSDKTGTLTQNKLTLGDPYCADDVKPEQVVIAGALASRKEDNDPIDLAVLSGIKETDRLDDYKITHFSPFDPVHKRTEAAVTGSEGNSRVSIRSAFISVS